MKPAKLSESHQELREQWQMAFADELLNQEVETQISDLIERYDEDALAAMKARLLVLYAEDGGKIKAQLLLLDEERFDIQVNVAYYAEELAVAKKQLVAVFMITRLEVIQAVEQGTSTPPANASCPSPMVVAGGTYDARLSSAVVWFDRGPEGWVSHTHTDYMLYEPDGKVIDHPLLRLFAETYMKTMEGDCSMREPTVFTANRVTVNNPVSEAAGKAETGESTAQSGQKQTSPRPIFGPDTGQSLYPLFLYKSKAGLWVFDDEKTGLIQEPFIQGADTIIDALIEREEIRDANNGFTIVFSPNEFPGFSAALEHRRPEAGGAWYYCPEVDIEGWLCPALYKYFKEPPERIWIEAMSRSDAPM